MKVYSQCSVFQSPSKNPPFLFLLETYLYHDKYPIIFTFEDRMSCSSNISGKTLLSKVLSISSPQPKARVLKKPQLEVVVLHANLKLIEEVNIFKDDTAGKQSIVSISLLNRMALCQVKSLNLQQALVPLKLCLDPPHFRRGHCKNRSHAAYFSLVGKHPPWEFSNMYLNRGRALGILPCIQGEWRKRVHKPSY